VGHDLAKCLFGMILHPHLAKIILEFFISAYQTVNLIIKNFNHPKHEN